MTLKIQFWGHKRRYVFKNHEIWSVERSFFFLFCFSHSDFWILAKRWITRKNSLENTSLPPLFLHTWSPPIFSYIYPSVIYERNWIVNNGLEKFGKKASEKRMRLIFVLLRSGFCKNFLSHHSQVHVKIYANCYWMAYWLHLRQNSTF